LIDQLSTYEEVRTHFNQSIQLQDGNSQERELKKELLHPLSNWLTNKLGTPDVAVAIAKKLTVPENLQTQIAIQIQHVAEFKVLESDQPKLVFFIEEYLSRVFKHLETTAPSQDTGNPIGNIVMNISTIIAECAKKYEETSDPKYISILIDQLKEVAGLAGLNPILPKTLIDKIGSQIDLQAHILPILEMVNALIKIPKTSAEKTEQLKELTQDSELSGQLETVTALIKDGARNFCKNDHGSPDSQKTFEDQTVAFSIAEVLENLDVASMLNPQRIGGDHDAPFFPPTFKYPRDDLQHVGRYISALVQTLSVSEDPNVEAFWGVVGNFVGNVLKNTMVVTHENNEGKSIGSLPAAFLDRVGSDVTTFFKDPKTPEEQETLARVDHFYDLLRVNFAEKHQALIDSDDSFQRVEKPEENLDFVKLFNGVSEKLLGRILGTHKNVLGVEELNLESLLNIPIPDQFKGVIKQQLVGAVSKIMVKGYVTLKEPIYSEIDYRIRLDKVLPDQRRSAKVLELIDLAINAYIVPTVENNIPPLLEKYLKTKQIESITGDVAKQTQRELMIS